MSNLGSSLSGTKGSSIFIGHVILHCSFGGSYLSLFSSTIIELTAKSPIFPSSSSHFLASKLF